MNPKHVRHKQPVPLNSERGLIIACPQFRSGVNLARMVRLAGCSGVRKMVVCGNTKIDPKIARDAAKTVKIERRRTLTNWLKKQQGIYRIVALEQVDHSHRIYDYKFRRKTVLVIGHERLGVSDELLSLVDDVIEIPVYGLPSSYNVVTASTMAVYEYCRQFPDG